MFSTLHPSVFMALLALQSVISGTIHRNSNPSDEKHPCTYSQIDEFLTADCKGLQLNAVPNDLKPDIKVLDLRNNSIKTSDFSSYNMLQALFLDNNNVRRLESLQGLLGLQELSLRSNDIQKVSPSLVKRLPALRRLDLSDNVLQEPLGAANLIAQLCDLEELILEKTEKFLDFCDCEVLKSWAAQGLQVSPPEAVECKERIGWVMEGEVTCLQAIPEVPVDALEECRNRRTISAEDADETARASEDSGGISWWGWLLICVGVVSLFVIIVVMIRCGWCGCFWESVITACIYHAVFECMRHLCECFWEAVCCKN